MSDQQADLDQAVQQAMAAAQQALVAGELELAADHATTLLLAEPSNVAFQALFQRIIADAPDPFALAPLANPMDLRVAVRHAYILGQLERYADAAALMLDILAAVPTTPTWVWAVRWLRECSLPPDNVALGALTQKISLAARTARAQLGLGGLGPVIALTRELCTRAPADTELLLFEVTLLRQAKRYDAAVSRATELHRREPSWRTAIAKASAERAAGQPDAAILSYQAATQLDPTEASTYLDLGDTTLSMGDFPAAIEAYSRALELLPESAWASASLALARYLGEGDATQLEGVQALARAGDQRAKELLGLLQRPKWVSSLPLPLDPEMLALSAAIEALKQHPPEQTATEPARIRLEVAQLGAPSLQLGFILGVKMLGHRAQLSLGVARIPTPDPRIPRGDPLFSVWRYADTSAQAAVPAPDPGVLPAIVALASQPYDLQGWTELARERAASLSPTQIGDLLSSLVHVPFPDLPPESAQAQLRVQPMDWVQRVQIASCMLIAQLDAGWHGSLRRAALESLLNGPIDWTINAALVALTSIALNEPELEPDITQLFAGMRERLPTDSSFSCIVHPLACLWSCLPQTSPALRGDLWRLRHRVEYASWRAQNVSQHGFAG